MTAKKRIKSKMDTNAVSVESTALLACPFCGGRPKVYSYEVGFRAWAGVKCTKCGVKVQGQPFHIYHHCKCPEFRQQRLNARKLWNRRHQANK